MTHPSFYIGLPKPILTAILEEMFLPIMLCENFGALSGQYFTQSASSSFQRINMASCSGGIYQRFFENAVINLKKQVEKKQRMRT